MELHWCYICQEWYHNVESQGKFLFWDVHSEAHFNLLFSPFSECVSGSIDNTSSLCIIGGKFVEFELGEGFGGSLPEFHANVVRHVTQCPSFCPFCVYNVSLNFSARALQ